MEAVLQHCVDRIEHLSRTVGALEEESRARAVEHDRAKKQIMELKDKLQRASDWQEFANGLTRSIGADAAQSTAKPMALWPSTGWEDCDGIPF
jgi:uncharacterized protein YigA (DUF484 family)